MSTLKTDPDRYMQRDLPAAKIRRQPRRYPAQRNSCASGLRPVRIGTKTLKACVTGQSGTTVSAEAARKLRIPTRGVTKPVELPGTGCARSQKLTINPEASWVYGADVVIGNDFLRGTRAFLDFAPRVTSVTCGRKRPDWRAK